MKRIIIFISSVFFTQLIHAQNLTVLDSARNELYRINKVFDSSVYLGFNVDINYRLDSLGVTLETEQMSGNYVVNKKNLYYNMGGTEYVQTDSFSYTLYADSKIMIMAKNAAQQNSSLFPLKTFVDSMINYYSNTYSITMDTVHLDSTDYLRRITFTLDTTVISPADFNSKYTSFYVLYDDELYFPAKFGFSYKQNGYEFSDDSTISGAVKLDKHIVMNFNNYKIFGQSEIFKDSQYAIFDRRRKMYEPGFRYQDYQFITTGFENEDEEAQYYRELPAIGN